MISLYDAQGGELTVDPADARPPDGAVLIDLLRATPEEIGYVERTTGLTLPSQHRLSEVETSSRLAMKGDTLQVATPILYRQSDAAVETSPVGFVLGHGVLVIIRYIEFKAMADFLAQRPFRTRGDNQPGADLFLLFLEIVVDRMADAMEQVGVDLDRMSRHVFEPEQEGPTSLKPSRVERRLVKTLKVIGRNGDLTSHARDSLLGLGRLVGYVATHGGPRFTADGKARLDMLKQDIVSLNDYETRLTDKVQFLLDSTLGFINIEQNRTFKILTIASVIGIPPTFVVGLYGMNFKNMPEYDWAYGYQWGLLLIAVSIIVPTVWLKWRGWF